VRIISFLVLGVLFFGFYAVWDEPTKEERALALKTSAFIAAQYGNLPLHSNASPTPVPKTYSFRASRHGLVVFVTFGLTTASERIRLHNAAKRALAEIPELEAVSLELYEDHLISGKARFSARETVLRKDVTSMKSRGQFHEVAGSVLTFQHFMLNCLTLFCTTINKGWSLILQYLDYMINKPNPSFESDSAKARCASILRYASTYEHSKNTLQRH
jgi:hypothetical protein